MESVASVRVDEQPGIGLSAWACLLSVLLFSLGSSVLTPYFSMYVAEQMGFGVAFAGLLVTCKVVCQRGFALPGGWCTDWLGARNTAVAGVAIRATSFALLVLTPTRYSLLAAACLNGIGAALFQPAIRKILLTPFRSMEAVLARLAGLRSASLNVGAAIGPLLGLVLVSSHFQIACELIVAIYAGNLVLLILLRTTESTKRPQSLLPGLKALMRPELSPVLALQVAFFIAYSHLEYLMPISFENYFGQGYVALAFVVNTATVVVAQVFLAKHFRRLTAALAMGCFCAFTALMSLLPFVGSEELKLPVASGLVVASMILFTIGEIVMSIRIDVETAKRSNDSNAGSAFGFVSFVGSLALAGTNAINSILFAKAGNSAGWLVNALVLGLMLFLFMNQKGESK